MATKDDQQYIDEAVRRGIISEDPYVAEARRRGMQVPMTESEVYRSRDVGENIAAPLPDEEPAFQYVQGRAVAGRRSELW